MIFVLEDDKNIRKLLSYALEMEGFSVAEFEEAGAMYEALQKKKPRLLLLGIMLPGEDGFTVLKKIKNDPTTEDMPVIVMTAKDSEADKLWGLDGGADDYVTKPFGIAELMARIRAVLRRCEGKGRRRTYEVDKLFVDTDKHIVLVDEMVIALSKKEYDLLLMLLQAQQRVCTREELLSGVWGANYGESRTLDVHIRRLRKKLAAMGAHIETVKGVGYQFVEDCYETEDF